MNALKITTMLLLISQAIVAQTKSAEEIAAKHVERIDQKVNLSEDQKVQINEIVLASTTKILTLKEKGTMTPMERKEVKSAERAKINEVLSEEQRAILLADSKDKPNHNRPKLTPEAKKEMKKSLMEKRIIFESQLTTDEKKIIDDARTLLPERKERASLSDEERRALKTEMKNIHAMLDPIIAAHKVELDEIKSSISPKDGGEHEKHKSKHDYFAYRFLLMK